MSDVAPDQVPDGWSDGAQGYEDRFARFTRPYAGDALDALGVGPGTRLLDVAAGTGAASLQAVDRGASVLATDFAPGMVEVLRRRLAEARAVDSSAEVMDGQALTVPDDAFDAGVSMFGLMFFPDIAQGLAELRRAVRPGGKVAIGVWEPTGSTLFALLGGAMAEVFGALPPPRVPPWGDLGTAAGMERALTGAGLVAATARVVDHEWRFDDPAGFLREGASWNPVLAQVLGSFDPATLDRLAEAFAAQVRAAEAAPGGLRIPATIGVGTVPGQPALRDSRLAAGPSATGAG